MKGPHIIVCFLISLSLSSQNTYHQFVNETDLFLSANVLSNGVDYKKIAENPGQLNHLVKLVANVQLNAMSQQERKAYLINAYNILVIKRVVDNYPTDSPQRIADFFESELLKVGEKSYSLNQLEKELLFSEYPDPRLHFVLVCAAKGCPVISAFAYIAEQLDSQLNQQTKMAINDPLFVKVDYVNNSVQLSPLFKWYENDFERNGESVLEFINDFRINKINQNARISFYKYDWTLNQGEKEDLSQENELKSVLQTFTPSALFSHGQYEINFFNSIYSQQQLRGVDGDEIDLMQTQNFFTSNLQFTTGINDKANLNVGFDVFISKARIDDGQESALKVFSKEKAIFNRTVLSYIAPRIKFSPFKGTPRFSVQSALWIPVSNELEEEGFIAHNRYTWFTQLFFDKSIGEQFQLFLEADLLYRFKTTEDQERDFFRTPLSAFLSYFPTSNATIFLFSQYSPRFETLENQNESQFGLTQWFTQLGVGGKYQLTSKIGLELSYSDFIASRKDGAGHILNFGLRYVYR